MEIRWYWLAEVLGLVKDLSDTEGAGAISYYVSAKTDEVFGVLTLGLLPLAFAVGFIITIWLLRKNREQRCRKIVKVMMGVLLLYGAFSIIGIGPYIRFYPRGGGFFDVSLLEHLLQGIYLIILAVCLWFGVKMGKILMGKRLG